MPDVVAALDGIAGAYRLWLSEIPRRRCFDLKLAANVSAQLGAQQRLREDECARRQRFWRDVAEHMPSALATATSQPVPPEVVNATLI